MGCTKFYFQPKVVKNQNLQLLCYVIFFDILHHYGVIAASQICSVSRKYCAVLRNRFFFLEKTLNFGTINQSGLFIVCWCADKGHFVSNPLVSEVADILLWEVKKLSVSSIKAHRSMLSPVFKFKLPELGNHHILWDLIRSFAIEFPRRPPLPPCGGLDIVLRHLMSKAYEPLSSLSLQSLTKKTVLDRFGYGQESWRATGTL